MPFPAGVPTVTISKDYRDARGDHPAKISVRFTPSVRKVVTAQNLTIEPVPVNGVITNGVLSATLAATDGFTYRVDEQVDGIKRKAFNISVPADDPAPTYQLDELAPVEPTLLTYLPVRTVEGVGPDPTGNIDLNLSGGGPHTHAQVDITNLATTLAGKENAGVAADLVTAHTQLADPHTQYLTTVEGSALFAPVVHSHGGVGVKAIRRAVIANPGDTTLPNTAGVWAVLAGFELSIPAVVDDEVELLFNGLRNANANAFIDVAVVVGGQIRRYGANNGSLPAAEGNPAFYITPTGFVGHAGEFGFKVTANDLDSGNIRFVIAVRAQGSGTLYSSTAYPFRWRAINYGPVTG